MEDIIKLRSRYRAENTVVKSIDFVEGYGWTITFE